MAHLARPFGPPTRRVTLLVRLGLASLTWGTIIVCYLLLASGTL